MVKEITYHKRGRIMKYLEKYNRYIDNDCVIYRKNKEGKLIQVKPSINNWDYEFIGYAPHSKIVYVHRMVYEAFKGEIPEGMEIDHIDRNKHNNNPDNLRVVTRAENNKNRVPYSFSRPPSSILSYISSDFGKKYLAHFGYSNKVNPNQYNRELKWYFRHNKKCRWE